MRHLITILAIFALLSSCNDQTVRKQGFEVHGIDVSHYQQQVDWETVATQGVQFAFVKATEGLTHQDTLFCENWDAMKMAGIKRGAYHFFRPTISAEQQAYNFIDRAELGHGDLAPVLDVEVLDGVSPEELCNSMKTWLRIVENHFKVPAIIYSNQNFYNDHLAGHFQGHPVWVARYSSWFKPSLDIDQDWQFWQYGNRGQLKGIMGNVDFNVFRGSMDELELLCLVRPEPLFEPPVEDTVASSAP